MAGPRRRAGAKPAAKVESVDNREAPISSTPSTVVEITKDEPYAARRFIQILDELE